MLLEEHSSILSTFIKLPFVIKIFVLSIFERLFYTGSTVKLYGEFKIQFTIVTQYIVNCAVNEIFNVY